ncbi:MAG: RecX family transcriptional regulator [Bacteroidales bacterium]|nr:MAG: RecX family transcriptional regulator [Bacteroidales bacterium]
MKKMNASEALERMKKICSQQEKCSYDIRTKLDHWKITPEDAELILQQLKKENFIDDSRYSKSFVREKFRIYRWGKLKIEYSLKQKKIPANLIEEALDEIDNDQYAETLQLEIKRKRETIKAKNLFDLKGKLYRYAYNKGFESNLIYRIIDKIIKE